MYSSRGSDSYGQQSYTAQSSYGQNPSSAYPGSSAGGSTSSSQLTMGSRHPSILGGPLESELGGFRAHPAAAQYGGQYGSLYGQSSLSAGQQGTSASVKGSGPSTMEGRTGYGSGIADSPKYTAKDYVAAASHGYGHKSELLIPDKMADYVSLERRQFAERQGGYMGRDLPVEAGGRYADSVGYAHKSEMYDRLDQASILRQEHMLKSQSLQSASHEASRQADYLAVRSGTFRHPAQELVSYGGRLEADPRVSAVGNSPYGGQPAPSILGAAPQRNVDDIVYAQTSSNPGYGVSLPPGRDYGMGKGLHGTALDSDFPGSLSSRSGLSRVDDLKDDRYPRVLDVREDERRREQLRDKERERDRDRERERERDREKERERKRLLELRERERERERDRDRERKRALESRRDRTPPKSSKDRRGSSLTKDGKPSRRDSPRREALHRIHSPVREKRREYTCKVYTSSLVDVERDYLSLDKRYPRLYISPDFSKVVVNWPRVNLKLPMYTPVSFEHDFADDASGAVQKELSTKHSDTNTANPERRGTVWNAKMILMSGLSRGATEDLCSEKLSDDRIPHLCNLLRFAVLKKDRSLMAIGGPWDAVDGGDPSLDESSLVHTILRYAKDLSHLDLQNCQHWNRFLEIHYDRVGKDGLFSHREITVLFVPDLSDCLPSLNVWREQWLAHKKAVAGREKQLSLGKEKPKDKRDPPKESSSPRDSKKAEKKKEVVNTEQASNAHKEKDGDLKKASTTDKDGEKSVKSAEKKKVDELTEEEANNVEKKGTGANTSAQKGVKPAKKKIVRKIVKQKVTDKVVTGENGGNDNSKLEDKLVEPMGINSETGQQDSSPANATGVKTFTRKKVAKKLSEADAAVKEVDKESGLKSEISPDSSLNKSEEKIDATGITVVRDGPVKRVVKRKIIKRVPKKKATGVVAKTVTSQDAGKLGGNVGDAKVDGDKISEGGNLVKCASTTQPGVESSQKHDDGVSSSKVGKSADQVKVKEEDIPDEKKVSETKNDPLRSLSLSLDSLLDYSDNDVEEETFELSVFAESFYEMLQYQMSCRVLTFLQRLKTEDIPTEEKSSKPKQKDETISSDEKLMPEEDDKVVKGDELEKTDDAEKDINIELGNIDAEQDQKQDDGQDAKKQVAEDNASSSEKKAGSDAEASKQKEARAEISKKASADKAPVDKELLQAFRFFDRNRVGYLRVEDLRVLIHNLGKFFSHRDVKELVQSALLESNTGRDDRILYEKLVRMSVDMDKDDSQHPKKRGPKQGSKRSRSVSALTEDDISDLEIGTKSGPSYLCRIMEDFSDEQKKDVIEIGFGGLLHMNLQENISHQLYNYIVTHYNPHARNLIVGKKEHAIHIDSSDIADVLGIPFTDIPAKEISKNKKSINPDEYLKIEWRRKKKKTYVDILTYKMLFEKYRHSGAEFKKMFVMFAVSTILAPIGDKSPNFNIIKSLEDVCFIKSFNWAGYVMDFLCGSIADIQAFVLKKKEGKELKTKFKQVNGYLVAFAIAFLQKFEFGTTLHRKPFILNWSCESLNERIKSVAENMDYGTVKLYPAAIPKQYAGKSEQALLKTLRLDSIEFKIEDSDEDEYLDERQVEKKERKKEDQVVQSTSFELKDIDDKARYVMYKIPKEFPTDAEIDNMDIDDANQGNKEPENKADDFNGLNVVQGSDVVQNLDREPELVEGTTPSEKEVHSVSNEGLLSSTSPPRTPKKPKGLNEIYSFAMNENQARLVQEGRSFLKGDTSLPRFTLFTPTPPTSQDTPVVTKSNDVIQSKATEELPLAIYQGHQEAQPQPRDACAVLELLRNKIVAAESIPIESPTAATADIILIDKTPDPPSIDDEFMVSEKQPPKTHIELIDVDRTPSTTDVPGESILIPVDKYSGKGRRDFMN
uniref:EF-hand domain-containing protein n=1 Tax=Chenopodium quinoa TaxID=63459 RepID=A0A803MUC0_CHEQI